MILKFLSILICLLFKSAWPQEDQSFEVTKQEKCKVMFRDFLALSKDDKLVVKLPKIQVPIVIMRVLEGKGAIGVIEHKDGCPNIKGERAFFAKVETEKSENSPINKEEATTSLDERNSLPSRSRASVDVFGAWETRSTTAPNTEPWKQSSLVGGIGLDWHANKFASWTIGLQAKVRTGRFKETASKNSLTSQEVTFPKYDLLGAQLAPIFVLNRCGEDANSYCFIGPQIEYHLMEFRKPTSESLEFKDTQEKLFSYGATVGFTSAITQSVQLGAFGNLSKGKSQKNKWDALIYNFGLSLGCRW